MRKQAQLSPTEALQTTFQRPENALYGRPGPDSDWRRGKANTVTVIGEIVAQTPLFIVATAPVLLGDIILREARGIRLRHGETLKSVRLAEITSRDKSKRYRRIDRAVDRAFARQPVYQVFPTEIVRILSVEESKKVLAEYGGGGGGGGGVKDVESLDGSYIKMPYYKEVTKVYRQAASAPYDPNILIYDPETGLKTTAQQYYESRGVPPPETVAVFEINGEHVFVPEEHDQVTVKTLKPIIPRADVEKINEAFALYFSGKITRAQALMTVTDTKSLNTVYDIAGVGMGDFLRDMTELSSVFAEGGSISSGTVKRILQIIGIGNQTSRVKTSEMVGWALTIGKMSSGNMEGAWKQALDVLPEFLPGYANTEILERIGLVNDMFGKDADLADPSYVRRLMQDPVINMALQKMGANSDDFAKLPPQEALRALLLIKDAVEGRIHPLEIAQSLAAIPGMANALPKFNGVSAIELAVFLQSTFEGFKRGQLVSPEQIVTISRAFGLDPKAIRGLHLDKAVQLYNIYTDLVRAKNDPRYLEAAVQRAGDLLPQLFPGINNGVLMAGVMRVIGNVSDPVVLLNVLSKNYELRKFIENVLKIDMFDDQGRLRGLNMHPRNLAVLLNLFQDVSSGRILPLTAAATISELGLIKGIPKVGGVSVIELASSMDSALQAIGRGGVISSKDLSKILQAAKINPREMGVVNPRSIPLLANAIRLYGQGKQSEAIRQLAELLPDVMADERQGKAISAAIQILAGSKTESIGQLLETLENSPEINAVLKGIGIPTGKPPRLLYALEDGTTIATDNTKPVAGTLSKVENGVYYVTDPTGKVTQFTKEQVQGMNLTISPSVKSVPQKGQVTKQNALYMMPLDEKLAMVAALKQLLDGKADIFRVALILGSLPTMSSVFKEEVKFVFLAAKLSRFVQVAGRGEAMSPEMIDKFIKALGLGEKVSLGAMSIGQATTLYSSFIALQKGDVGTAVMNAVRAFPDMKYSEALTSIARNYNVLESGNPAEIVRFIYGTPEVKAFFKSFMNLPDLGLTVDPQKLIGGLTSGTYQGNIPEADLIQAGSVILDVIQGKLDPTIAARQLINIPTMQGLFPSVTKTLSVATALYDVATQFGRQPINPADIDKALSLLGINGGLGALSYGEVLGAVNALSMLFQGKWQQAAMQALMLLNITFGGIPVGVIIQILFMIFPGLASILGKGGKKDRPKQNCQHCGCAVRDPAGADNCRSYKPGCAICTYCGTELRSARNPQVYPGQPSLNTDPVYPLGANSEALVPRTRTGLKGDGCGYVDGSVGGIDNQDCKQQEIQFGQFSEANYQQFSLYCKDSWAFYGNMTGGGGQGATREQNYEEDKPSKDARGAADYMILTAPIKKRRFMDDTNLHGLCNPLADTLSKKDCEGAFLVWSLVKDDETTAALVRNCGFIAGSQKSTSFDDAENNCGGLAKQLTTAYNGLSSRYRDAVFDAVSLTRDKQIRKLIS